MKDGEKELYTQNLYHTMQIRHRRTKAGKDT